MANTSTLSVHSGGVAITRADVFAVPTPARTASWVPIPHKELVGHVLNWLQEGGLELRKEAHALAYDGARYFGVFDLVGGSDYGISIGLRNAHDKSFCAGLAAGARVFVCDNLSFSGEITLARKHTVNIRRDLSRLCADAFGRVHGLRIQQDTRIAHYKGAPLTDTHAHDILIRSVDAKVIPNADIPKVLTEWRTPRHEVFQDRTAWSLFNAYTEVAKEWNQFDVPARTQRLHALLDIETGAAASIQAN